MIRSWECQLWADYLPSYPSPANDRKVPRTADPRSAAVDQITHSAAGAKVSDYAKTGRGLVRGTPAFLIGWESHDLG